MVIQMEHPMDKDMDRDFIVTGTSLGGKSDLKNAQGNLPNLMVASPTDSRKGMWGPRATAPNNKP